MQPNPGSSQNPRIYLLTHPRTASNLLTRILALEDQTALHPREADNVSTQDTDRRYGYFFLPTMPHRLSLARKRPDEWTEQERADMIECFQDCVRQLVQHTEEAEQQGKLVFVKEHLHWMVSPLAEPGTPVDRTHEEQYWKVDLPPTTGMDAQADSAPEDSGLDQDPALEKNLSSDRTTNQTVLPDKFLQTWTPTFLIRHPALVFPSIYRTSVELEGVEEARRNVDGIFRSEMTMRWSRNLWEWYHSIGQKKQDSSDRVWPIVLDADDIILEPKVVERYCALTGLDPSRCRFEWTAATQAEQDALPSVEKRMKSSLLSSTGIIKEGKTAVGLNIDEEVKKWQAEFGVEEAEMLKQWVHDAMPDYQFMRARRLRP